MKQKNLKMNSYNGYVMVAADLSTYPRGSIVETSLGTGFEKSQENA